MYLYCLFLSVVSAKWLAVKIAGKITWTVPIGILNYTRQWECFFSVIFAVVLPEEQVEAYSILVTRNRLFRFSLRSVCSATKNRSGQTCLTTGLWPTPGNSEPVHSCRFRQTWQLCCTTAAAMADRMLSVSETDFWQTFRLRTDSTFNCCSTNDRWSFRHSVAAASARTRSCESDILCTSIGVGFEKSAKFRRQKLKTPITWISVRLCWTHWLNYKIID